MNSIAHCYQILGLPFGASPQDIKHAYRNLAKAWHPDRYSTNPRMQIEAQERFKEIQWAYHTLLDSCKYDQQHDKASTAFHFETTEPASSPNSAPPVDSVHSEPVPRSSVVVNPAYEWFIKFSKLTALILTLNLLRQLLGMCSPM
jgi:curved DNA-binding protein CbpA